MIGQVEHFAWVAFDKGCPIALYPTKKDAELCFSLIRAIYPIRKVAYRFVEE